jgi:hypothetical protein
MKEVRIVNCTPHKISIQKEDGQFLTVPPSGTIARVTAKNSVAERLNGFIVYNTEFGEVENLPDPQEGVIYLVSRVLLNALQGSRSDCFSPGNLLRDENGQPIGCQGLSQ